MTTSEQKRRDESTAAKAKAAEEAAAAKEERGDDEEPKNGIQQPTLNTPPASTVTDALGTDRIVAVGVQDAWKPAPVEPDPEQVKLAKEREAKAEEEAEARREGRIDPVSGRLLSKAEWAEVQKERKVTEKDQA